ncbi:LCP family protein [Bacillus cereus]|uniref:LCP family protein n=1 Tax=Bacillus cereus TaxID=1396 RepID=UPI000B4C1C80|nr:LCP family protein [Bacillus cereus]
MKIFGFIKFITSVFFFGVLVYGGYFVFNEYIWNTINPKPTIEEQITKEVRKISSVDHFDDEASLNTKKPFAMVLLGVDGESFKNNRSDTIMLSIVDPKNDKISLLSIPRDLRVQIPGQNGYEKINAAFAKGGVDLTAATIQKIFGVPIEHYAVINFKGFQDMVEAIGGVDVKVEKDLTFSDRITKTRFSLKKGDQTLNGIQALNYARFRGDGEGDFGRMRRQQQVVKAIIDQTISVSNIPKIVDIMGAIDKNFTSNVSYKDLGLLALKMRNIKAENIDTIKYTAEPKMIKGVSYVVAEDKEVNRLRDVLQDKLNGIDVTDKENGHQNN